MYVWKKRDGMVPPRTTFFCLLFTPSYLLSSYGSNPVDYAPGKESPIAVSWTLCVAVCLHSMMVAVICIYSHADNRLHKQRVC
jgi:hypothetical protein